MGVVTGDRNESETSRWGVEDLSAGKYEFAILTMSYRSEVLSGSTVYSGQLNGLRCEEAGSLPYIGPRKGDPGPKNSAMTSTFKPSWTRMTKSNHQRLSGTYTCICVKAFLRCTRVPLSDPTYFSIVGTTSEGDHCLA